MGMGLFETEFITPDYVPNLIVCGEHDREVITEGHHVFVKGARNLEPTTLAFLCKDWDTRFLMDMTKEWESTGIRWYTISLTGILKWKKNFHPLFWWFLLLIIKKMLPFISNFCSVRPCY